MIHFENNFHSISILPVLRVFVRPYGFAFGWLSFYWIYYYKEKKAESESLDEAINIFSYYIKEIKKLRQMEKAINKYPDLRRAVKAAVEGGYECDKKIDWALMAHNGLFSEKPQQSRSAEEPPHDQPSPVCTDQRPT